MYIHKTLFRVLRALFRMYRALFYVERRALQQRCNTAALQHGSPATVASLRDAGWKMYIYRVFSGVHRALLTRDRALFRYVLGSFQNMNGSFQNV